MQLRNLYCLYVQNPMFYAFAVVTADGETILWLHTENLSQEVRDYLAEENVQIMEYDDFYTDLAAWGSDLSNTDRVLVVNPSIYLAGASYAVYESLPEANVAFGDSPILLTKAIKNQVY